MTIIWPDWTGLNDWQTYMGKEHIKNDVRNGFEIGVRLANSLVKWNLRYKKY